MEWHDAVDNNQMAFYTLYHTTKVPTETTADLDTHIRLMDARTGGPPLVVNKGVVCRMVDFAPGYASVDHRSLSIDYGVVIEGKIELILDSGEVRTVERGGMTVQRGTMHQWRNPSQTEWARMFFVLVSAEQRRVGGMLMKEDLGGL
jgi:quercetin dioxygenase-like cupin family protein